jgi:eukaryotic-like serine/threonine-protein kinase
MSPEDWMRVRSILEPALELDASSRPRFLDEACTDPELRRDVESLIELHEQAGADFLNAPPVPGVDSSGESKFQLTGGTRVGAYEIVEEIAQGGMGTVYRAVRADGQYTQEVALKIVRAGIGAETIAARFRNERQILAGLDHPNIGKLLDGGTTSGGLPYFVMEYIDGLPITEYCDQRRLSIDSRLRLFQTVCAAVHYAHQHLVIHRDIKPTNILVTRDGVPKLLDFGIAKVLNSAQPPQSAPPTVSGLWMMTPEYASPEQVRGEVVTTATDVYSLGLVLYELLTGERAHRITNHTPYAIAQLACDKEPVRPSVAILRKDEASDKSAAPIDIEERSRLREISPAKLERRLDGDLDNIVLMALRKEAPRRYSSVEQFAEDIRRHLENIPVAARQDSAWYRTSKFVSRHKASVAATIAMAVALLGGFAITMYEAHVAREQAEVAHLQRARAERRFNDVRKLANSLMFEVHDSIRDLPGAMPARKLIVERAREYLDSLSQEATGDQALQRELAGAYDRIGDLLGNTAAANLGDFPGALQNFNKALAIREASAAANPDDTQIQADLLNDYFRLSFVLQDAGDYKGALGRLEKGLPVAQTLAAANSDPKYKDWLAGIYWKRANVYEAGGNDAEAIKNFRQSIAIREPIAASPDANPLFRTHLAADYIGVGRTLGRSGDAAQALESFRSGLAISEPMSEANPNNATLREYLGETYGEIVPLLEKVGDLDQAFNYGKRAQETFAQLLAADPTDSLARDNLAFANLNLGEILSAQGKFGEAQPNIRTAISTFEGIQPKNHYESEGQSEAYSRLAKLFVALADRDVSRAQKIEHLAEARDWFQKSLDSSQQIPSPIVSEQTPPVKNSQTAAALARCDAALAKLRAHR